MKIISVEFIKSCRLTEEFPRSGLPEIAFVGRSNVGKSSLINSLVNRKKLAKVSRTPGKTQTINFFQVTIGGSLKTSFYVVDLPGYGYAKAPKSVRAEWGPMIEAFLTQRSQLRGVVLLVDSRGIEAHDRWTLDWLAAIGRRIVVVTTKVDKLSRSERSGSLRAVRENLDLATETDVVPYSSVTHDGREELWGALRGLVGS